MKYPATVAAAALVALVASWTPLATAINRNTYDWLCRLYPVTRPDSEAVVIAIDEAMLQRHGGLRGLRSLLAAILDQVNASRPKSVAIDFTLADPGDPQEDAALAAAMARTPNLVLAADLTRDASGWQDPVPAFAARAGSLGHVHAEPDPVCRRISLDKAAGRARRWALAFEAWRAGAPVTEEPDTVSTRGRTLPREVYIRFSQQTPRARPDAVTGKAVFIGATALTAARDRLMTPLGEMMAGVDIHAQLYETIREGRLRREAGGSSELIASVAIALAAGLIFARTSGWIAYLLGAMLIAVSHALPHAAFQADWIFPAFAPLSVAWLTVTSAATFQYFATRRQLATAEADRSRYQQAIHWVTHEMRTPLTAIQGSSELMRRYNLPPEKQRQIADMINSESKRLAQMIQTFLNVERLSAGQMELRNDAFPAIDFFDSCVQRARPLAEQKSQRVEVTTPPPVWLRGDRELMEFALYNLLTNAVKYSPEQTSIEVRGMAESGRLRLSVQDQGIGIGEADLAKLGTRFFRTAEAERSGIAGTGIGLSIVREILSRHGGELEVTSRLGEGSCFTIVVPAVSSTPEPAGERSTA